VALPFALKFIVRQKKKSYGKLKYFTIQEYNVPKILKKKPKSFKVL
jgi:hypothetical protein